MQALFVLYFDLGVSIRHDEDLYLRALPKLLGLPNLISYVYINEFIGALYTPYDLEAFGAFFGAFQWDPARSGGFHHDPTTWRAFVATRMLQFFATATSR